MVLETKFTTEILVLSIFLAAEGGQAEKFDFLGPYIKGKNSENCEFEFSHLVIWGGGGYRSWE